MKRIFPVVALSLLFIPLMAFAQNQQSPNAAALKKLGLSDAQVTQVMDVQKKTQDLVRQDSVSLRLIRDKIDQALLPANPDVKAVNGLVDQAAQTRAEMQKALLGARIQLRQIMGDDNYRQYIRSFGRFHRRMNGPGPQGFRRGMGGMDGRQGPDRMGDGQL
jgi:hypothetical protein